MPQCAVRLPSRAVLGAPSTLAILQRPCASCAPPFRCPVPYTPSPIAASPLLTVVITCMGRLAHLQASLPCVVAQAGMECIVVDYGCPEHAGDWVERHYPRVQVLRAGAVQHFNVGRARNLGAAASHTPWLCLMDADTLLGPDCCNGLLPRLAAGHFYRPDPQPPDLCGMVVCALQDFRAIGGYDELFEGWGCEDRDLYLRLQRLGCKAATFPSEDLRFIAHDDAMRTRHHAVSDRFLSLRINGMYLQIKNDLALQIGKVDLDPRDRQALYARIRQRVLAQPQQPARMDIDLPAATCFSQPPGWRLHRTIRYRFEPEASGHGG